MKELKFITDAMLGKLTRWLRMLGHDVEYVSSPDDKELIKKAEKENRVLLTRDVELHHQAIAKGVDSFLVESPNQTANLANLAQKFEFKLEIDMKTSRCPKCNGELKEVSKINIAEKIPFKTSSNYDKFWQCKDCGQIYWRGTHWTRIDRTLEEARKALAGRTVN
jgi:uncharacterized protein with PIN domain